MPTERASILPSLLVHDEHAFFSRVHTCEESADLVHIDIADGRFVPNTSWADPVSIQKLQTPLRYELHLMVENPLDVIRQWGGIPSVARIIVHAESRTFDAAAIRTYAHEQQWDTGIGFKLDTDPAAYETIVADLNPKHVLCMGIHRIGFSGQSIDIAALELLTTAVKDAFAASTTWNWIIDGGVKKENMPALAQLGFTSFVLASEIFGAPNPKERIRELQALLRH